MVPRRSNGHIKSTNLKGGASASSSSYTNNLFYFDAVLNGYVSALKFHLI
jgi:hypothetical protein